MKKAVLALTFLAFLQGTAFAGDDSTPESSFTGQAPDSTEYIESAVLRAVRGTRNAPFAVTKIDREELSTFGADVRELPFLFARTPGVIAWGENGLGTGTTYMRIRGAGDSRINVTIDGVPLNSPEDQCVFWANMGSYANILESVNIQRGVGSSSNGDGAFGGTISLGTRTPSEDFSLKVRMSYGSFNTRKGGMDFSSGLLGQHWIFDASVNASATDGYVHGTSGRQGSYTAGLTHISERLTVKYRNIGNFEETGQAWNGVIAGDYDGYFNLNANGVKSYSDLYEMGLGRLNSLYEIINFDSEGKFAGSERYQMRDGSYWDKTTDNFYQNKNILSAVLKLSDKTTLSASAHYTYGYGYYEEFKFNNKLKKYGLENFTLSDGSILKKTDFVRQKGVSQNTGGVIANLSHSTEKLDLIAGAALQCFKGNHFGYLSYMGNEELENYYLRNGKYKYYDSDAWKNDANAYVKATYNFTPEFSAFGDLQFRHVSYRTDGYNDKYHDDLSKHLLDIDENWNFFNPKAGFSYTSNGHKAFASVAVSHREPERNNFTDNGGLEAPVAEKLVDYELGYSFTGRNFRAGADLYYMDYDNQFVQTGALSDIGEALTTNLKDSYRLGMELVASWTPVSWLNIEGNAALSRNRVLNFDEVVTENYDADWNLLEAKVNHFDESTLAYSPSVILNGFVTLRKGAFDASWHSSFVGRQYLDNSSCLERSIPSYTVSNLSFGYSLSVGKYIPELSIRLNINNVFDSHYAACAFVWYRSIVDGNESSQLSYIPSAGRTALLNITLSF